jgi:hypothetical protein
MTSKRPMKKNGRYRSGLEKKFAEALPARLMQYEPFDVSYVTYRKYKPDFVYKEKVLVECKGFFREGDTQKYKAIRDCISEIAGMELIFVLSDPHKKVRKGGKLTMGQWCDKEGLKHYTLDSVEGLIDYVLHR